MILEVSQGGSHGFLNNLNHRKIRVNIHNHGIKATFRQHYA
jgi:hypothetical protein